MPLLGAATVRIDPGAVDALLNSPDGPVGQMLAELSAQAASVARATVRIRRTVSKNSDARPPGFTRASIHTHMGWNSRGRIYGGVNAAADPAIFLEYPAEQMEQPYPFLTTGLWSLEGRIG